MFSSVVEESVIGGTAMNSTRIGHARHDDVSYEESHYCGRAQNNSFGDVRFDEPGGLGNPYTVSKYGRERCIELFREDFETAITSDDSYGRFGFDAQALRRFVASLSGTVLVCWCRQLEDAEPACHCDVIAEWIDVLADMS